MRLHQWGNASSGHGSKTRRPWVAQSVAEHMRLSTASAWPDLSLFCVRQAAEPDGRASPVCQATLRNVLLCCIKAPAISHCEPTRSCPIMIPTTTTTMI